METFVLERRGPWNDVMWASVVVIAKHEAMARVIACEVTGEDDWGKGDTFATCRVLVPEYGAVAFRGGGGY